MVIEFRDGFPIVMALIVGTLELILAIWKLSRRMSAFIIMSVLANFVIAFMFYYFALEWYLHLLLKLLRTD